MSKMDIEFRIDSGGIFRRQATQFVVFSIRDTTKINVEMIVEQNTYGFDGT